MKLHEIKSSYSVNNLLSKVNVLNFRTVVARPTRQTQIRLLLKKQSNQDLPCLLFWQAVCETNISFENRKVFEILEHLRCSVFVYKSMTWVLILTTYKTKYCSRFTAPCLCSYGQCSKFQILFSLCSQIKIGYPV